MGCNAVWSKEDGEICESCGEAHYNNKGKAKSLTECVVWFPLTARLTALLTCPKYVQAVRWENDRRGTNPEYMSGLLLLLLVVICCSYLFI